MLSVAKKLKGNNSLLDYMNYAMSFMDEEATGVYGHIYEICLRLSAMELFPEYEVKHCVINFDQFSSLVSRARELFIEKVGEKKEGFNNSNKSYIRDDSDWKK